MANRASYRLAPALPPAVMEQIRRHLSRREMRVVEAVCALRNTAQQVDNAIAEWLAGTSPDHLCTCLNPECQCGQDVLSSRDPLTSLMMQADGVTEGDLRAIAKRVAVARGIKSIP